MNDCPNADFRDQLPDLLHERLDATSRARVVAHVDGCAACRDELALLRRMNDTLLFATPRIDVARIVLAIPHASAVARGRRSWRSWRVAAAVTILTIGGVSVAVLRRNAPIDRPIDTSRFSSAAHSESLLASIAESARTASPMSVLPAAPTPESAPGLAMTGRLGELTEAELKALLDDIEKLEAVPMVDPEPVGMTVTPSRSLLPTGV
jgi:Putative zinc-finger